MIIVGNKSSVYIDPQAKIGENVKIYPGTIIEGSVVIEDNCFLGPNTFIQGDEIIVKKNNIFKCDVSIFHKVFIDEGNIFFKGACIGEISQHLRSSGDKSKVIIGKNNLIREFVTINRGTDSDRKKTVIKNNTLIMAYAHIAHDCLIEDEVIISNSVQLAGHVTVEKGAVIGGLSGIHQFVRIGKYTMIGGASAVERDIPHFCLAKGNRAYLEGINIIGLKRRNFNKETIKALLNAYEIIFGNKKDKKKTLNESLSIVLEKYGHILEVKEFVEFIKNSKRGCTLPKKYNDKNNDRKGKKKEV